MKNTLLLVCFLFLCGCTNDAQQAPQAPDGQIMADVDGKQFKAIELLNNTILSGTMAFLWIDDDPMLSITGYTLTGDMIQLVAHGVRDPGQYPLKSFVMVDDTVVAGGSQGMIVINGDTATTNDSDVGMLNVWLLDTSKSRHGNVSATFNFKARAKDGSTRTVTNGVANKIWLSHY